MLFRKGINEIDLKRSFMDLALIAVSVVMFSASGSALIGWGLMYGIPQFFGFIG